MLSEVIFVAIFIVFLSAPLVIQLLLYQITKLCFKKISPAMYIICLAVNTILLYWIKAWLLSPFNPDEMEPTDAFDGVVLLILWAPCYLGVAISCIIKIIKAIPSEQNTDDL